MAQRAANPFYIEPAKFEPPKMLLQGIGAYTKQARQAEQAKAAQTEIATALQSGDPMQIANTVIKYPQYADAAKTAFGFTNKATEDAAKDAYRRALADPENAAQYMQEGIDKVTEFGGRPTMMSRDLQMIMDNPEGAQQAMKMGYAGVDPQGYKALFGDPKDKFKARELQIKEDTLELRKLENESRRDEQALEQETNQLKRDELQLKIQERQQKIDEKKRDFEIDAKTKIQQAGTMTAAIDEFLGNKRYVSAMTGWRGRTPAVTTVGLEAEGYFNQIKNNLTLENLNKMTGVLTDKDIEVLSGAASALQAGMSEPAMRKELNKIKDVLKDKSSDVQGMILGTVDAQPQQPATGGPVTEAAVTTPLPAEQQKVLDQQALDWANANPDDPRAAQIRQRLGQ